MALASLTPSSDRVRIYQAGTQRLADAYERLASGNRVVRLGDDVASVVTAVPLQKQVAIDRSARSNSEAGISLVQVVQQGLQQIQLLVDTLAGIATQGTDAGLSAPQRDQLNAQFTGTRQQIDSIASSTQFNGIALLNGSLASPGGLDYAVGGSTLRVSIPAVSSTSLFSGAVPNVNNTANASLAVTQVANAQIALSRAQAIADSYVERFGSVDGNLQTSLGGVNAAIRDLLATDSVSESQSIIRQFLQQNTAAVVFSQAQQLNSGLLNLI